MNFKKTIRIAAHISVQLHWNSTQTSRVSDFGARRFKARNEVSLMFPRCLKRGKPSKMYSLVIIHMSYCIFLAWKFTILGEQSYFLSTFLKGLLWVPGISIMLDIIGFKLMVKIPAMTIWKMDLSVHPLLHFSCLMPAEGARGQ